VHYKPKLKPTDIEFGEITQIGAILRRSMSFKATDVTMRLPISD